MVGLKLGTEVGLAEGAAVGTSVGTRVGKVVGDRVGALVGTGQLRTSISPLSACARGADIATVPASPDIDTENPKSTPLVALVISAPDWLQLAPLYRYILTGEGAIVPTTTALPSEESPTDEPS